MNQVINLAISFPFFLFGLFILWKKLRDDYIGSQIFSLGFIIYFSVIIIFVLRKYFNFPFSEWVIILVPMLITIIYSKRNRLRLNEVLNAIVPSYLIGQCYFYFINLLNNFKLAYLIGALILLCFSIIFKFTEKKFKHFVWYKSGKVGISGLLVFALVSVTNAIIAILSPSMVFFSGKLNAIILFILGFISLISIVFLSKKTS